MFQGIEKEDNDRTLRKERDGIVGLGARFPGDEAIAVDGPSNCVTLYVAVDAEPVGVVRVNLFAELMGIRELVASVFPPSGFRGIAAIVTGLHVDGWHASFQASNPRVSCKGALQAARGCSGFAVSVPMAIQAPPSIGDLPPEMVRDNPAPLQVSNGLFRAATEADGFFVAIGPGERVLSIDATAGGAGGTITIIGSGRTQPVITLAAGAVVSLRQNGSLVGPGSISFAGIDSFTVQLVR